MMGCWQSRLGKGVMAELFEKSFEHSQALFSAALEEFADKGYEQASINTILVNAGMSKGQFYYHFKNKEALYLALMGILIAKKREFLAANMDAALFQGDIFTLFKAQIQNGLAFAAQYPAINRFAESFIKEKGRPIYETALAAHHFGGDEGLSSLIDAAYGKGDFRDDLPLTFIKGVILYLFTHAVEIAALEQAADFEERMAYLIEFMKTGLKGV